MRSKDYWKITVGAHAVIDPAVGNADEADSGEEDEEDISVRELFTTENNTIRKARKPVPRVYVVMADYPSPRRGSSSIRSTSMRDIPRFVDLCVHGLSGRTDVVNQSCTFRQRSLVRYFRATPSLLLCSSWRSGFRSTLFQVSYPRSVTLRSSVGPPRLLNGEQSFGTKRMLLLSSTLTTLFSILLAIGLNQHLRALSGVSVIGFVISFSIGLAPMAWVVLSEVMPREGRTAGGSVAVSVNWLTNFAAVSHPRSVARGHLVAHHTRARHSYPSSRPSSMGIKVKGISFSSLLALVSSLSAR